MLIPDEVRNAVRSHPCPLLFAAISGAHLYGFPSPDSDWDLRGAHILPAEQTMGLFPVQETVEISSQTGPELDIVSHDIRKFFGLLLRPNGYVLEQLLSPLVVHSAPEYEELKALAPGCITRFHVHHYLGFAASQWRLFAKEDPPRLKPLLYVFRVLLTGIHLMQTGQVESNLRTLNQCFRITFLPDLIARKIAGRETETLASGELQFFAGQFAEWEQRLFEAGEKTHLPGQPSVRQELNDLLVRLRLKSIRQDPHGMCDEDYDS
jgi:uncharacterized protein